MPDKWGGRLSVLSEGIESRVSGGSRTSRASGTSSDSQNFYGSRASGVSVGDGEEEDGGECTSSLKKVRCMTLGTQETASPTSNRVSTEPLPPAAAGVNSCDVASAESVANADGNADAVVSGVGAIVDVNQEYALPSHEPGLEVVDNTALVPGKADGSDEQEQAAEDVAAAVEAAAKVAKAAALAAAEAEAIAAKAEEEAAAAEREAEQAAVEAAAEEAELEAAAAEQAAEQAAEEQATLEAAAAAEAAATLCEIGCAVPDDDVLELPLLPTPDASPEGKYRVCPPPPTSSPGGPTDMLHDSTTVKEGSRNVLTEVQLGCDAERGEVEVEVESDCDGLIAALDASCCADGDDDDLDAMRKEVRESLSLDVRAAAVFYSVGLPFLSDRYALFLSFILGLEEAVATAVASVCCDVYICYCQSCQSCLT